MNVFRIKINPTGHPSATPEETFGYCIVKKLLGVGWGVGDIDDTSDWSKYEHLAIKAHGEDQLQQPRYIKDNVCIDDLVWTRGPNGSGEYESKYYLARVIGEWEYRYNPNADIHNVFKCDIIPIKTDDVPGKVIRAWTGLSYTIQRVTDVGEYSKLLWNKNETDSDKHYPFNKGDIRLFPLLDAQETEDVLALFLQRKGWYFVPNSANEGTTQKYEFMVTKPGEEHTWTQVKSGYTPIDLNWYKNAGHPVIVWQPNGCYKNEPGPKNVTRINSDEILEFVRSERAENWLPGWLVKKAQLASDLD